MKRTVSLFMILAAVAAMFFGSAARADDKPAMDINKPIAVISFSGYDGFFGDLKAVGNVAGDATLASGPELLLQMGLGGALRDLDKSLPAGCLVMYDGEDVGVVVFVPYGDLDTLVDFAQTQGMDIEAEEKGDNLTELTVGGDPMFVKRSGKYLYFSMDASLVADVPEDATTLLGGLDKKYTFAARADAGNLDPKVMDTLFKAIDEGMNAAFDQQLEMLDDLDDMDEDDEDYQQVKAAREMTQTAIENNRKSVEFLKEMIRGIAVIEVGYRFDRETDELKMHLAVEAKEGSDLARSIEKNRGVKSRFAGFDALDAIMTAYAIAYQDEKSRKFGMTSLDDSAKVFESAMKIAKAEMDEDDEDQQRLVKYMDMLTKAFPKFISLLDIEYSDMGMAVDAKPGNFTAVLATTVADTKPLDEFFSELLGNLAKDELVREEWVKKNVEKWEGYTFHQVRVTLRDLVELSKAEPDEDELVKMELAIGETLVLTYGTSKDACVVGLGPDAIKLFKQGAKPVDGMPVGKFRISSLKLLDSVRAFMDTVTSRRDKARMEYKQAMYLMDIVTAAIKEVPGQDGMTVISEFPSDRRAENVFILEKGVVRLAGSLPKVFMLMGMYDPDDEDDDFDDEDEEAIKIEVLELIEEE